MDMRTSTFNTRGVRALLSRFGCAVLNGAQFLFTLAWSALCISAALLVLALTPRRELPLCMASRPCAPGVLLGAGA